MLNWRVLGVVAVLVGLPIGATLVSNPLLGEALASSFGEGEILFSQKCSPCHSLGGGDRPTGPDLAGVIDKRDRQWLVSFITDPEALISAGDPIAVELLGKFNNLIMPAMALDADQVESLLVFLAGPAKQSQVTSPEPASSDMGDSERGAKLFTGEIPMTKGGAPCLACHGIAGVGLAGSANYGPDLTSMFENFGEEGIAGILESLPFPSMEPIYATRPLTDQERLDLGAFFEKVSDSTVLSDHRLKTEVAGGVLALVVVFYLFGWGRLTRVRRSLVDKASNQKGGMR